jgi:hypothetical protein
MVLNFIATSYLRQLLHWAVGQVPPYLAAHPLLEAEEYGGYGIPTTCPPRAYPEYTTDIISDDRLDGYMVDA